MNKIGFISLFLLFGVSLALEKMTMSGQNTIQLNYVVGNNKSIKEGAFVGQMPIGFDTVNNKPFMRDTVFKFYLSKDFIIPNWSQNESSNQETFICKKENSCDVDKDEKKITPLPFFMKGALKGYTGNTVALFKEDQKFDPQYYTNPDANGTVNGYFLTDDSKDQYPYGDRPLMNLAIAAGYLKKLTTDYTYGKYFGLKFSVEANDKFTENELRRANQDNMFTASLTLNNFSDMKEKNIDSKYNWQYAVASPYSTYVVQFQMSYKPFSSRSTESTLYGYQSLPEGQEKNKNLFACLKPDAPYFISTTAPNGKTYDKNWIGNLMQNIWDGVCGNQSGCDANHQFANDGPEINLGVPIQFNLLSSARRTITLKASDFIYKDENETKLQSTIKTINDYADLQCDISLGILFFRKYDLVLRYNSKPDGPFEQQFQWNVVLAPKGSGWSWTLVAMIGGMVLGFSACIGCVCFFRRGEKGGEGEKFILERFVGYNPRVQSQNVKNIVPSEVSNSEYTQVEGEDKTENETEKSEAEL